MKTRIRLPQLVENVLQSKVMKSASPERGRQVIERAKCLDCHKFGAVGQGLGPDLTTVRSRFRPIEILESIVEPSKVISDQYKAATIATVDGKVYNGMPVVSDGPALVLLLSDGTKVDDSQERDRRQEGIERFGDARRADQQPELSRDCRFAGAFRFCAASASRRQTRRNE